jgi:hypothetical protein
MACPARFERATYALEAVKMRLKQLVKQWYRGVGFWCPVGTENRGVRWNAVDLEWHWQAVGWSDVKFVG